MILTLKIIFLFLLTFCLSAATPALRTTDYQDALLEKTVLPHCNNQQSCAIAYERLHRRLAVIVAPEDLTSGETLSRETPANIVKFCNIVHTLVKFVSRSRYAAQLLEINNRSYNYYLELSTLVTPHMATQAGVRDSAAATKKVRTLFFNTRFSDLDLQNVLLKRDVLAGYPIDESTSIAYTELHERLAAIVSPHDLTPTATLAGKTQDILDRFCNIVRTFVHFVGWDVRAHDLLEHNHISHDYYLGLIDLVAHYDIGAAAQRNLVMGKAKLRLLSLQKRMREANQDYNTADPDSAERLAIYTLLDGIHGGAKVRLLEMVNLIVTCGYSPTGNPEDDLALAQRIMDEYRTPRKSTVNSSSLSASAAPIDIDSDDDSTSSSGSPLEVTSSFLAVHSVPHIHGDTAPSNAIGSMARQLQAAILRKQKQLRQAQPVLQEGHARGVLASVPVVDDAAMVSMGVAVQNVSDSEEELPIIKRAKCRKMIDDDSDDESVSYSNAIKEQQTKRLRKKAISVRDETDEDYDHVDIEDKVYNAPASASAPSNDDLDSENEGTVRRKAARLSDRQKEEILKLRTETTLTCPQIAEKVSCTPIQVRKYCAKKGLAGTTKQRTQALHSRIQAELDANPHATYGAIADKIGDGLTCSTVAHYVSEHAPEHRKPQAEIKNEKLTKDQKAQIEQLLLADRSMEYQAVAAQVGCDSTQVSKYVNRHAPHLKKRTVREYDRRTPEKIAKSDELIIRLINSNQQIGRTEICRKAQISLGHLRAFERRHPEYKYSSRVK